MSVTDQGILNEIQSLLAETIDAGATFSSGMWTPAEVLRHMDCAQQDLFAETGLVIKRTTIACVPHVSRQDLPSDWIATQRLVWVRGSDNRHFPLHRSDVWELDAAVPNWRNLPGPPLYFTDGDVPTLTVQLAPPPDVPGDLRLFYVGLPTHFTGAGQTADVPDEAALGILWGSLWRMLLKDGRAKDPARAAVASERADLVLEAVKLILRGWET